MIPPFILHAIQKFCIGIKKLICLYLKEHYNLTKIGVKVNNKEKKQGKINIHRFT